MGGGVERYSPWGMTSGGCPHPGIHRPGPDKTYEGAASEGFCWFLQIGLSA